jgi:hypothetical protein
VGSIYQPSAQAPCTSFTLARGTPTIVPLPCPEGFGADGYGHRGSGWGVFVCAAPRSVTAGGARWPGPPLSRIRRMLCGRIARATRICPGFSRLIRLTLRAGHRRTDSTHGAIKTESSPLTLIVDGSFIHGHTGERKKRERDPPSMMKPMSWRCACAVLGGSSLGLGVSPDLQEGLSGVAGKEGIMGRHELLADVDVRRGSELPRGRVPPFRNRR